MDGDFLTYANVRAIKLLILVNRTPQYELCNITSHINHKRGGALNAPAL